MENVTDPPGLLGPFVQTIPVNELNTFFARCNMTPKYEVVSKPTEQEPDFMLKMTVSKMNSMGIGRTKAGAKQSALTQLLRTIIPSPNINDSDVRRMRYCAETLVMFTDESIPNAVMEALQKLCESRKKPPPLYRVLCEGLAQSFVTVVTCKVGPTMVIGMGKTKKRAKRHAAFKLLFYFSFGPGKYDQEDENINRNDPKASLCNESCSNKVDFGKPNSNIFLIQSALAELVTSEENSRDVNNNDDVSQSCTAADDTFRSCTAETALTESMFESMENISPIPYEMTDASEMEEHMISAESDARHVRKARSDETLAVSRFLAASKAEELIACVSECQAVSTENNALLGRVIPVGPKNASLELCDVAVGSEDRFIQQELVGDNVPMAQVVCQKLIKVELENERNTSPSRDSNLIQLRDISAVEFNKMAVTVGDAETMRSVVADVGKSYHKGREKKRRQCTTQPNLNSLKNSVCVGEDNHLIKSEKSNADQEFFIPQSCNAGTNTLPVFRPTSEYAQPKDTVKLKSLKQILEEFPELVRLQVPPSSDDDVYTDSDESRLNAHLPTRCCESEEFVANNRGLHSVDHDYIPITDDGFVDEDSERAKSLEPGEIYEKQSSNHLETYSEQVYLQESSAQELKYKNSMDADDKRGSEGCVTQPRSRRSTPNIQVSSDQLPVDHLGNQDNVEDHDSLTSAQATSDHFSEMDTVTSPTFSINAVKKHPRKRAVQIIRSGKEKGMLFENLDDVKKARGFPLSPGSAIDGASEETLVAKCQTCGANGPKPMIIGWERDEFEERWVDPYAWEPLIYIFLQFAMFFVVIVQIVVGILFIFTNLVTMKQMLVSMVQAGLVVLLVRFS